MPDEVSVDLEKIQSLCEQCDIDRSNIYEAINSIRQQINAVIEGNFWVGQEAEAFRQNMEDKLTQVYNATKWINHITYELKKHADRLKEQEYIRAEKMRERSY